MSQHTEPTPIASIKSYILGFSLALTLTALAFAFVHYQIFEGYALIAALLVLAAIQTFVQLYFFLHIGQEGSKWNAIFLFNTIGVILLIVIASIWIMNSLNYRMMSPDAMEKYMLEESHKGF